MKKYFYSILAAGMLFACSHEDIVDVTKGEGQQVTIKVELPASESRAIAQGINVGEGNMADNLIFAMYEEDQRDGEPLITRIVSREADGKTFKVTVPMAKDVKYDFLFLAYDKENPAFIINSDDAKTNNLNALKLRTDLKANQESYDAFVGMLDSKGIDAAENTTVTLVRPFAQVNAATTAEDLAEVKSLSSEVTSSSFIIYNAPNTLDVFSGTVSGQATHEYVKEAILTKYGVTGYPNNEDIVVGTQTYKYLTMAYVLAGKTSATYDADFKFYRSDDKMISSLNVLSLPVQANYRTNVVGTLLTQSESYEVTISEGFAEPYLEPANNVEITPANVSGITIESNTNYKLTGDFNSSNVSLVMAAGVENVVFDGSKATGINELIITQNGQLIDNATTPVGERSGKVTVQNFNVLSQINVFACKTEVVVQKNTAEALMIYAGNCDVKVLNNTIDANFESHTSYKDATSTWSNANNYGIALNIFDYNLWLDGNTVTDATGHAIGINGWEGTIDNGDENVIESFKNNKITVNSTTNTKRAAFKVWDDETYASNDDDTNAVNATAQAFINAVLADGSNTFKIIDGYNHTIFCFYNVNTNN